MSASHGPYSIALFVKRSLEAEGAGGGVVDTLPGVSPVLKEDRPVSIKALSWSIRYIRRFAFDVLLFEITNRKAVALYWPSGWGAFRKLLGRARSERKNVKRPGLTPFPDNAGRTGLSGPIKTLSHCSPRSLFRATFANHPLASPHRFATAISQKRPKGTRPQRYLDHMPRTVAMDSGTLCKSL